jgi:hypothetical protein
MFVLFNSIRLFAIKATVITSGFCGLGVACWSLVPEFAGSNLAEAVRFFRAKKVLSMPSFGGGVKPPVPCRRFAACKRSLQMAWNSPFVTITGHFSPIVPLSLIEVSRAVVGVGAPSGASGNFQSRARTISLNDCSTSGGTSHRGPME